MTDTTVFDPASAVQNCLKTFLRAQERAKPDHYGPNFTQACDAEALFNLYFGEEFSLELFRPDGYRDFAELLLRARELNLVEPEQDDDVCYALGEIWLRLTAEEQAHLETAVATL